MPELPEVETITQGMIPLITDKTIVSITIKNPNLRWPVPNDIQPLTQGKTILSVKRRSKYILLQIEENKHIIIHLGMSGSLVYTENKKHYAKHDHVILFLNKGTVCLNDPRRFGCFLFHEGDIETHPLLAKLGPEPTEESLDPNYLYQRLKHSKRLVKNALMDSNILPGIGNIYANEALFLSRIHPETRCEKLSQQQWHTLQKIAIITLKKAIQQGGTTLKDFLSADGKPGYFQQSLNVYGRTALPCHECQTPIEVMTISSRSSFYCPNCQKH